jgi:hypothetical protein
MKSHERVSPDVYGLLHDNKGVIASKITKTVRAVYINEPSVFNG